MLAAAGAAVAQGKTSKHDPGVTDTSIKIGNIMPYSGPASAYGVIGTAEAAYFRKVNDEGGVNGRKINFISYDNSVQSAQGRGAGTKAGRGRRGIVDLQFAGHTVKYSDPEIHE